MIKELVLGFFIYRKIKCNYEKKDPQSYTNLTISSNARFVSHQPDLIINS